MNRIDTKILPPSILPERALQFGEGNFLRAFIDWMLHRMNESGVFGGSVVVVQPLKNGLVDKLNEQKGLYTLYLRGIVDGNTVSDHEVITSLSRGINPYSEWETFLETAENPDMRFVVSNTTEAGITYESIEKPDSCPALFPAKMTIWLLRRFECLGGSAETGMVMLPCELINYNGTALKECILKHASDWALGNAFTEWIEKDCTFLNTLVDRIVPGYPRDEAETMTQELGYQDDLICTGEIFHLMVIEGPEELKTELPFHKAGLNVIWTEDMQPYRTRKVGILNGAHTASVLGAYLGGVDTVLDMMKDDMFGLFTKSVVFNELLPALPMKKEEAESFAEAVMERFLNPFIQHELLSISLNSVSKWRVRVLPSVKRYIDAFDHAPPLLSFSLAALIAFYKGTLREGYTPKDDAAVLEFFSTAWKNKHPEQVVDDVLRNTELWGEDLRDLPGFKSAVSEALVTLLNKGSRETVTEWVQK